MTDHIETLHPVRRRGGIIVWEGPRPVDDDEPTADEAAAMLLGVLHKIAEYTAVAPLVNFTCDDCGCSLRTRDELCPACAIAWCRWQEIRASWRRATTYYRPRQGAA